MAKLTTIDAIAHQLDHCLNDHSFVKLSLGNYQGSEQELKQIHVRETLIKGNKQLSFTYRYKTKDIVKNYDKATAIEKLMIYIDSGFRVVNLHTTTTHLTFDQRKSGQWLLHEAESVVTAKPSLQHDHQKHRWITSHPEKRYLRELKLVDASGQVYKNAQDKYKQINQYIALLKPLIDEIGPDQIKEVVDMGSGKGYLTFALYDYLSEVLHQPVHVTGVEYRADLVEFCNQVARASHFGGLHFDQGEIAHYKQSAIDMLIALHACDTATDDALFQGIKAGAKLIVVAPCCHKQIRKEMEKHKAKDELRPLTQYGIFLERQAEMLTDTIRALLLTYHGYKTKVFEFISDAHTPKNVMIVGVKTTVNTKQQAHLARQIKELKDLFGIRTHYLEKLFSTGV